MNPLKKDFRKYIIIMSIWYSKRARIGPGLVDQASAILPNSRPSFRRSLGGVDAL